MTRAIAGANSGITMPAQHIYEESETLLHPVGERLQVGGRTFIYALAGAALDQGYLLESAEKGGAVTTEQIDCTLGAVAAGADTITLTTKTTAQTKNLYANGWLSIVSDTNAHGAGVAYEIASHPAQTAAGALVFTLKDQVYKAITTDCKGSLCTNLWYKVKQTAVTTAVGMPVGVSLIDVTSGYYFWCQTWGPAAVLTGSTALVDSAIIRGLEDGESDIQATAGITPEIGYGIQGGSDGDFPLMYLRICP